MLYRKNLLVVLLATLAGVGCLALARMQPIFLAGSFAGSFIARYAWGRAARAKAGARSEQRVAKVLARLAPAAVVHGADLGSGGDADHVVLGPVCAVIETKTGRGAFARKSIPGKPATVTVGAKTLPRDPVRQAQNQARLLRKLSGQYVAAVVCVVDMTNGPLQLENAWVCSLADLPQVLRQLPRQLTVPQAQALADQLTPAPH